MGKDINNMKKGLINMSHRLLLIGASIATIGTTLALTSCSQQQPQKKGYLTFESTTQYDWTEKVTILTNTKTYDLKGFITSYDPTTKYKLNDEFMNNVMKLNDERNIYFHHSGSETGNRKWYNLAEYYNVVYKQIPQ